MKHLLNSTVLFIALLLVGFVNGNGWRCLDPETPATAQRARAEQCAQAIMTDYPISSQEGIFHFGSGGDDTFLLPVIAVYGSCQVTVSMEEAYVQSSWSAIWAMALTLKDACTIPGTDGTLWTSGYLAAGITISLGRYVPRANNLTEAATNASIATA